MGLKASKQKADITTPSKEKKVKRRKSKKESVTANGDTGIEEVGIQEKKDDSIILPEAPPTNGDVKLSESSGTENKDKGDAEKKAETDSAGSGDAPTDIVEDSPDKETNQVAQLADVKSPTEPPPPVAAAEPSNAEKSDASKSSTEKAKSEQIASPPLSEVKPEKPKTEAGATLEVKPESITVTPPTPEVTKPELGSSSISEVKVGPVSSPVKDKSESVIVSSAMSEVKAESAAVTSEESKPEPVSEPAAVPEEVKAAAESVAAVPEEVKVVAESVAAVPEEVKVVAESVAAVPEEVKAVAESVAAVPEEVKPEPAAADVAVTPEESVIEPTVVAPVEGKPEPVAAPVTTTPEETKPEQIVESPVPTSQETKCEPVAEPPVATPEEAKSEAAVATPEETKQESLTEPPVATPEETKPEPLAEQPVSTPEEPKPEVVAAVANATSEQIPAKTESAVDKEPKQLPETPELERLVQETSQSADMAEAQVNGVPETVQAPETHKENANEEVTVNGQVTESSPEIATLISWKHGGQEVAVCGDFNKWEDNCTLIEQDGIFSTKIKLTKGQHHLKFLVDGKWTVDESEPVAELDGHGKVNILTIS